MTFLSQIRQILRGLLKSPGYTAAALLTLALGIGANTAIFSLLRAVVLRPLPYPGAERLVQVLERDRLLPRKSVAYPNYEDWRDQSSSFEALGTYRGQSFTLTGQGDAAVLPGADFSEATFRALGAAPALGRTFGPEDDRPGAADVVVLSHRLWKDRFGARPDILGTALTLNGRPHTVVGVMPETFAFPSSAQLWVPMAPLAYRTPGMTSRGAHPGIAVLGRLKAGVSLDQGRKDLEAVAARLAQQYPNSNNGATVFVQPLQEALNAGFGSTLGLLLGAVGFVLLIACVNVTNLSLARALSRQRDLAVRFALGATRSQVIQGLVAESLLVHLAGGALGLGLAWTGLKAFMAHPPAGLPPALLRTGSVTPDGVVLLFTAALSLVSGVLFGLYPAFHATRVPPAEALKEGAKGTGGPGRTRLRALLVAAEVALATVLLVGSGLLIRSLGRVLAQHPGYRAEHLQTLQMRLPFTPPREQGPEQDQVLLAIQRMAQDAVDRVKSLPGVEAATFTDAMPLADGTTSSFGFPGQPMGTIAEAPMTEHRFVSPDFFGTLGTRILRGRALTAADQASGASVAVIDEGFARRFWPGQDPLGQAIVMGGKPDRRPIVIVGVAETIRSLSLDDSEQAYPQLYLPLAPHLAFGYNGTLRLMVRSSRAGTADLERDLRAALRGLNSDIAVSQVATFGQVMDEALGERRLMMALVTAFSVLALVLAGLGIYAVTAFTVAERTKEIGIRMALGAQVSQVLKHILRQGLRPVALGLGLGAAGALALGRLLASQLYRMSATDPATFGAALLTLAALGALACLVPARRAAHLDPVTALRED